MWIEVAYCMLGFVRWYDCTIVSRGKVITYSYIVYFTGIKCFNYIALPFNYSTLEMCNDL